MGGGEGEGIQTATGVRQGCDIECDEDEILVVDPHNGGSWGCHATNPNSRPLLCPGKFNTECGCKPTDTADEARCAIGDCDCDHQLWVNHNCTMSRMCSGTGPGEYVDYSCADNATHQYVHINLVTHNWFCGTDPACPGSFHVGCDDDPTPDPSSANGLAMAIMALLIPAILTIVSV